MEQARFPAGVTTVGQKVEYVSRVLLPARRFEAYLAAMGEILAEDLHYIDPVHELRGRTAVLKMLGKYVPRAANEKFQFQLLHDGADRVIWKWTIALKLRFAPFEFVIHGLVHAEVDPTTSKIVYQREYYDPMESIEVIPLVGSLYKRVLQLG